MWSATKKKERRTKIPDKPKNASLNVLGFLKQFVGKDLTKVAMPVNFNEPLSLLQRVTEDLEYSQILDTAASCSCYFEQLAYVAVFAISTYASSTRVTKPFNPLLGETFEFDRRDDLGWRAICEKVCHHPPTFAQFCEGKNWVFTQEFTFESKFTGNDIELTPNGEATIMFKKGNTFSWNKAVTLIRNFVVGSLRIDQQGDINLYGKNGAEGVIGRIRFVPPGNFMKKDKEYRKVNGEILDGNGNIKWTINGNWDRMVEIVPVNNPDDVSKDNSNMGTPILAWTVKPLSPGAENYYNFSIFACQLNEIEDGVAPTDSRLRPDQRLMEEGKWDEANKVKVQLEEKQRRKREEMRRNSKIKLGKDQTVHEPTWFNSIRKDDGSFTYQYKGTYWSCKKKKDWSKCPDIFL